MRTMALPRPGTSVLRRYRSPAEKLAARAPGATCNISIKARALARITEVYQRWLVF
jgi:hypothetical protein